MTRQLELRPPQTAPRARPAQSGLAAPAIAAQGRSLPPAAATGRPQSDGAGQAQPRIVPNISIHAFCEASTTADALASAGTDRRLAKAQMEVSTGGIEAAIADCSGNRAPNLLMVETALPRSQMLAKLNVLCDRCDPATRLILIGQINDIVLYRELIRRGVGEYLIAPVSPAQVVDAVVGLCGVPGGTQAGSVIAFVGAKGGTGSSTVCHNVAWAMSEILKTDVVVADLDLAFGTAGLDFNQEAVEGMAEALAAPERLGETALDRLLTRCSQHLSILAAPVALDRDYDISPGACGGVLDALRQHAPFVAVDLPHVWTPWLRQVLVQADEIVITAAPDLANLRNARNLVDLLEAGRPGGKAPHLVVNMARRPRRPDIPVEELAAALDLEPRLTIEFDGETFGLAANNGRMVEEHCRKARAAQQFRTLALALAQRAEPQEPARASPLAPILDRLRLRA